MKKDDDERDIMNTNPEGGEEEPEWFDEEEPEESEGSEGPGKPEEPEQTGEAEQPEESEQPGEPEQSVEPGEPEESEQPGEPEQSVEPGEPEESEQPGEPEQSGEPEWYDEAESDEEEPEWYDEAEPEDPNSGDDVDDADIEAMGAGDQEPDSADVEGDSLAGIVAAGLKEEPDPNVVAQANSDGGSGRDYEAEAMLHTKKKKRRRRLTIGLCIVAAVVVVAYLGVGYYFRDHFLPGTVISGIECDYMTIDELEDIIQSQIDQYEINIVERGGEVETLRGVDFGIRLAYGDTLEEILQNQGAYLWPKAYFGNTDSYDPGSAVEWDEAKILTLINEMDCMDIDQMIDPTDAEILYSETEKQYYIQPEEYGTHIQTAVLTEAIENAVSALDETIDLDEAECYQVPNITVSSEEMSEACDKMNKMLSADITYDMLDVENIHIDADRIKDWIVVGDDYSVTYDTDAIWQFITDFAEQYDTRYKTHYLQTSWGGTATATNSGYGWELDQQGEYDTLIQNLENGDVITREPVWYHTAKSHGEYDFGGTYVEINLTRQHLYFYKNGSLIIDSDFVSGRMTPDRVTDAGIYYVYYKQENAVLKGEDYETPVSYWMPFNGGEGMHDATWRGSFGGTIYMYSGSHGCINLPYSAAQTIYENVSVGDCVFVYWEDGYTMDLVADASSSSSSSSSGSSETWSDTSSTWSDSSTWDTYTYYEPEPEYTEPEPEYTEPEPEYTEPEPNYTEPEPSPETGGDTGWDDGDTWEGDGGEW